MTNPDNVGGLLNSEFEKLMRRMHKHGDSDERYIWDEAIRIFRELCRAAPAGGDVECFVREMRTSKGAEFFVVVKRDGRELTPHMYTERWKAEYDVASWQHLLCGAPEPDLLAYGPSDVSAPAGSGEVSRLELAKMELAVTAALFNYEQGDTVSEWLKNTAALLRKLQQGAGEGREG